VDDKSINAKIGGGVLNLLIDSGATCNINNIDKETWKQYKSNIIRCTTLLPPFLFRNSRLYCKKLVIHL